MPTVELKICDECANEIDETPLLIYSISYWADKQAEKMDYNFLLDNGEALMFCDAECLGRFFEKSIRAK